jgi:hypothetical protein
MRLLVFSIVISFIIISLSSAYNFVFYLPNKEDLSVRIKQLQVQVQKTSEENKSVKLYIECLEKTENSHNDTWVQECNRLGKNSDCLLPDATAYALYKNRKDNFEYCRDNYQKK